MTVDIRAQITSAKYRSIFLNATNADANSMSVIAADVPTSAQSGARPNTSAERKPSTIALSGLSTNNGRKRADTAASGYATGVRYSQSCNAICTTGLTSR